MTTGTIDRREAEKEARQDEAFFRQETMRRAKRSFPFFYRNIFSESVRAIDGSFVGGQWPNEFATRLQTKKKTATIAARKHSKTTVVLGFLAWLVFKADTENKRLFEYAYIMFSDNVACEKMKLLKQYIKVNSYFAHILDLKPQADSVVEYQTGLNRVSITPTGIFSFLRSKHPDGVICDDILKDPEKRLDLTQIEKITQIFEAQITPLCKEGGFIHVVGTAQDETDILFKLRSLDAWDWSLRPAILDRKKRQVLWPEMFTFERLLDIEINETGKKNFRREYQCEPVRGVEGFFSRGDLEAIIDTKLKNYGIIQKAGEPDFSGTISGMDIGKKRHPSHIAVFDPVVDGEITYLVQVASIWLDGTEYNDQVEICRAVDKRFNPDRFPYDNTRAELEGFAERGELPDSMQPITLSAAENQRIASDLDLVVGAGAGDESRAKVRLILLNDERQTRSLLSVDDNLKAPESGDGHGDAFFSIGLAVRAYMESAGSMIQ